MSYSFYYDHPVYLNRIPRSLPATYSSTQTKDIVYETINEVRNDADAIYSLAYCSSRYTSYIPCGNNCGTNRGAEKESHVGKNGCNYRG